MTFISDVCRLLVEHRKSTFYHMINRLMCLILTLPVSTTTTERAFSSLDIIKSTLRNKMNDEFLDDLMRYPVVSEMVLDANNAQMVVDNLLINKNTCKGSSFEYYSDNKGKHSRLFWFD
ncbi:hypothetical protein QQ045_031015 [Rhodiola kirilowii]